VCVDALFVTSACDACGAPQSAAANACKSKRRREKGERVSFFNQYLREERVSCSNTAKTKTPYLTISWLASCSTCSSCCYCPPHAADRHLLSRAVRRSAVPLFANLRFGDERAPTRVGDAHRGATPWSPQRGTPRPGLVAVHPPRRQKEKAWRCVPSARTSTARHGRPAPESTPCPQNQPPPGWPWCWRSTLP